MSLPSGYTRLEYIESTGTQYIDTGFKPNNNTRVVLDFEPTAAYSSIVGIFGIRDTQYATAANMFIFWNNGANTFRTDYFGTNKTMTVSTLLVRQTVDKDKNLTTIGSVSASNTKSTGRCSNNLYLFCTNDAGTAKYFAKLKLYSCQIYDNGTLIRDYIPCQTTSGVVGLWDNVNSKFYQNAKTGSFIAGGMPKGTHKTIVNGTVYEVKGGKCLVNGTAYSIKKGRTLIGGTGYDITFAPSLMLVKGDLITMNLDGTSRIYRVLSVNGNVCKVMGMWDDFTSKYNNRSKTTNFNGTTAQKYEGSTLDTYLNTTWYNTLSSEAKNAIVPENVVQYCYKYYDQPNTPNTPTYTYQYQYNWSDSDYENADNVGNVVVGNRNVFALDLKDIFDYMGKVCITSKELMTMFWNSTYKVSKYIWLRSSNAAYSSNAWLVRGNYGIVGFSAATNSYVVRPALNLDMSKIQYTLV